jgi:hypothetical protein
VLLQPFARVLGDAGRRAADHARDLTQERICEGQDALLHDGRVRLLVPGFLGLFAVTELHHLVETLAKASTAG